MENLQKQTLADQIYHIIREDILNQRLQCGEKITLKQLQDRFEISSTPIREALKRLGQDGLIEHETNVGARVVDISFSDAQEIYELCGVLDTAALRMSYSRNPAALLDALKLNLLAQSESLEAEQLEDFKFNSDAFHDIFYKYAENSRLFQACVRIRSQLTILTNIYQSHTQSRTLVYEDHLGIYTKLEAKDLAGALNLLELHFRHASEFLIGERSVSGE